MSANKFIERETFFILFINKNSFRFNEKVLQIYPELDLCFCIFLINYHHISKAL